MRQHRGLYFREAGYLLNFHYFMYLHLQQGCTQQCSAGNPSNTAKICNSPHSCSLQCIFRYTWTNICNFNAFIFNKKLLNTSFGLSETTRFMTNICETEAFWRKWNLEPGVWVGVIIKAKARRRGSPAWEVKAGTRWSVLQTGKIITFSQ